MRKRAIAGAVLVVFAAGAVADAMTVTVYTDRTAWEAALDGPFATETFVDDLLNPQVSYVSTASGHVNPALACYQDVLTSTNPNDPMTTWSFTPPMTAYGGTWTLAGPGGGGNALLVYIIDDADGSEVYAGAIANSTAGGFWGLIADTPFIAVRLVGSVRCV